MRIENVSLEEMLAARDRRAEAQREMLKSIESQGTSEGLKDDVCLVSFTLNIPGDIKRTPLTKMLFDRGIEELYRIIDEDGNNQDKRSANYTIRERLFFDEKTGSEALFLIQKNRDSYDDVDALNQNADELNPNVDKLNPNVGDVNPNEANENCLQGEGLAATIKGLLEDVEESFPAARLFDFDVLDSNGEKFSRKVPRCCLLCNEPAHACARSRAHGLGEVQKKVNELLMEFCGDTIGEMGKDALLMEIHTTPKPGLVDEENNGAHKDMDLALFEKSIEAITPYLKEAAMLGLASAAHKGQHALKGYMNDLRRCGIIAEEKMFQETGGVNTHKGIIYSMGLLIFGMGRGLLTGEDPVSIASTLAGEDAEERLAKALENPGTNGSKVYSVYGAKGAVGEAASGFPMARYCFERLSHYIKTFFNSYSSHDMKWDIKLKSVGTFSLVDLMSIMEDTNLLHRGGMDGLEYVKKEAGRISRLINSVEDLGSKSMEDEYKGLTLEIKDFDEELIRRNLSPGGSADMLSLGYLLMLWDSKVINSLKGETV